MPTSKSARKGRGGGRRAHRLRQMVKKKCGEERDNELAWLGALGRVVRGGGRAESVSEESAQVVARVVFKGDGVGLACRAVKHHGGWLALGVDDREARKVGRFLLDERLQGRIAADTSRADLEDGHGVGRSGLGGGQLSGCRVCGSLGGSARRRRRRRGAGGARDGHLPEGACHSLRSP